jgi:transcriptional regulator with XRE-family HTH domain
MSNFFIAHGLLTTSEIKAARKRLRLTQQQFADRLKAGIASVKRWELGAIQDESSDLLIRLSTDLGAARRNVRELNALHRPRPGRTPATERPRRSALTL